MKLKPCPFCGNRYIRCMNMNHGIMKVFAVVCGECKTAGPLRFKSTEATKAWNTRKGGKG
jgi:Lar family restriction alleviation protein